MKHMQAPMIYGIGNALLDMEFHVSDEVLDALEIEKGLMTLIDHERHHLLLEHLQAIDHLTAPGGSVANSIVLTSQLGVTSFMACRVADDAAGGQYVKSLQDAGVEHRFTGDTKPQGTTGKCLALITPDAERSMHSYLGISAEFCVDDLDIEKLKAAKILYIEGYLVASKVSMQAVRKAQAIAKEHGVKVALSLSDVNMVKFFKAELDEILQTGVDILFANNPEVELYTACEHLPDQQQALLPLAEQVIITHGAKGSAVCTQAERFMAEAIPVTVVDTLGAGDAFAGAYLAACAHGKSMREAATCANYVAGCMVSQNGPRFSTDDITAIKDQLQFAEVVL